MKAELWRGVNRLVTRLTRREVAVWYHPSYRLPLAQSVGPPMDPKRADDALTWALSVALIPPEAVRTPDELSFADALRVHTREWLASIDQPEVVAKVLGTDPERIPVEALLETWRRAAGATRAAALEVMASGGRAVNLLGGFHHAEPDRGGGFCAINDVAVAVACLRAGGYDGPVTIVDLDAHPPDGLVACLHSDPLVTIASISTASEWLVPPSSQARVLDVRVPPGTGDLGYHAVLHDLLRQVKAQGIVFYLAGADPLRGDRLGGLDTTLEGLAHRDERVFDWLDAVPCVALAAGGYSSPAWRVVAQTVAIAAGVSVRVDPAFDPLRHRTAAIARTLSPAILGGHDDDVLITEEELLGTMRTATAAEPRFLGYYTRHGLEHAFTAYQYLSTLERMGFRGLRIHMNVGGAGPDRLTITAEIEGSEATIVDLAASFRPLGRWRTLFVEWLELCDRRVSFSASRPRLPGQKLPGLGLAEETMQLLVAAAERLHQDGVSFIPAHYHVAWISRGRFTVWDPVARGRFQALVEHTTHQPLAEVSARMAEPGWPTEGGPPVKWEPTEMVIALAPGMQAELAATTAAADAAREALAPYLI